MAMACRATAILVANELRTLQGRSLPVDHPMRFPLSDTDFEFQADYVLLGISRYQQGKETGKLNKTWPGVAAQSLRDAFANKVPVELILTAGSGEPEFFVCIDGRQV